MDKPIKKLTSFKKLPKAPEPAKPTQATPEAQPASINVPEFMKPGTVLTEFEQEGLKQLGIVSDTSKLPSNIAEKISAAMQDAQKPMAMPNTGPLKIPDPVDFNDIPDDKKKDIADFIKGAAAFKKEVQQQQASKTVEPPLDPKIFKEPEIIDDLIQPKAETKAQPQEPVGDVSADSGLMSKDAILTCPHCGWDTSKADLVEIDAEDKLDFVQSILGGIRYKKVYELFGGKLRITFRTLTTAESDMAYKQLVVDAQNDVQSKIVGDTSFYWRTLMAYRVAMAVEKLESDVNIIEIPPILDIEVDDEKYQRPNTKLFALFDDLVEQIMPTELMRNTISHLYTEFQSLCEKLQAMAEQKDFWKATK